MKPTLFFPVLILVFLSSSNRIFSQAPNLNSAANFDLFSSIGDISNTGMTQFTGYIGTDSGAVTGFDLLTPSFHIQDSSTALCSADLISAYNQLSATAATFNAHTPTFGSGESLIAGVYQISGASSLAGTLTLNGMGNPDAVFIFKIGGAFTSGAHGQIILTNGARASNVFWQIEGAISFAAQVSAKGTFISHAGAISFGSGVSLEGRALTLAGAITTYESRFNIPSAGPVGPNLRSTATFVLFTSSGAVTNAGTSIITGVIGSNSGAITGFAPGSVVIANQNSQTAACTTDLALVYNDLNTMVATNTVHAPAFGSGETIVPGVYDIGGAASISGTLFLDGQGDSGSIFVIRSGGALTTGAGTQIILANGAHASNVFWIAEGAIALAANILAVGTFISHAGAISLGANCVLEGRALTMAGAVTLLDQMTLSIPVIKAVSAEQTICYGTSIADLVLTGTSESVVKWQKATNSSFTNAVDIANTTTILTGSSVGNLIASSWFRAVLENESSLSAKITVGPITTWNGSTWDHGTPDSNTTALFTGNYTTTTDIVACSIKVSNNAVVTVVSTKDVTLSSSISVEAGSNFILNNNSNLIQRNSAANSGTITVRSNSSALQRLDYTLWSSPVSNQNVLAFSPSTLANRFYTYDSLSNLFVAVPSPGTTDFRIGKGYLIRVPNNHPVIPTIWSGTFTGVPHNGDVVVPLVQIISGQSINLIGNPYPSAIDAESFAKDNSNSITGALYFWRKTNNAESPSYCTWTTMGFTDNGELQVFDPLDVISRAQGFFVESLPNAESVTFKNTHRIGNNSGQFFRSASTVEKNRIWLNASGAAGVYSQLLVGYVTDATAGVDLGIDGKYNNDGAIALTSLIDGAPYSIQGRSLPFNSQDIVPLQFCAANAGTYTIAIDRTDGLFAVGQEILLRDLQTGGIYNLTAASYSFACEAGIFNNRFELLYQYPLAVSQALFTSNTVVVYKQKGEIVVNTGGILMSDVKVFDISGRLIVEQKDVNATEARFNMGLSRNVLLVEITSKNGEVVTKKMIN